MASFPVAPLYFFSQPQRRSVSFRTPLLHFRNPLFLSGSPAAQPSVSFPTARSLHLPATSPLSFMHMPFSSVRQIFHRFATQYLCAPILSHRCAPRCPHRHRCSALPSTSTARPRRTAPIPKTRCPMSSRSPKYSQRCQIKVGGVSVGSAMIFCPLQIFPADSVVSPAVRIYGSASAKKPRRSYS